MATVVPANRFSSHFADYKETDIDVLMRVTEASGNGSDYRGDESRAAVVFG